LSEQFSFCWEQPGDLNLITTASRYNTFQLAFLALGSVFAGAAFFSELKLKGLRAKSSQDVQKPEMDTKSDADRFFFTLDDKESGSFEALAEGAHRISILSRTGVNLLGQYQRVFEQLGASGCCVRLLLLDPSCEAARYIYGDATHLYHSNVNTTASHLRNLRKKIGDQLQAKTTKHAPPLSIIIVERQPIEKSVVRVQLYFLHRCLGRDRPLFQVTHLDKWYNVFMEEFNQIWTASDDWNDSLIGPKS
jgi:hypothetical protein